MRILLVLILLGFALTSVFSINDAFGAGFIKFDGVDGESQDKEHKGWSDLLSFSENSDQNDSSSVRDKYEISDIVLAKELDKSSPKLAESIAMGKVFPKVEIHLVSNDESYLVYHLTNVMITSYSIGGSENQIPVEEFSLNYEKIVRSELSEDPIEEMVVDEPKEEPILEPTEPAEDMMEDELMVESDSKVPSWVQTTAQFWIDRDVSDREFTDALGFLVKEKIIEVEVESTQTESDQLTDEEPQVPDWIATTTEWWINGEVPEDQFLEGIKWMIKNKIIRGI